VEECGPCPVCEFYPGICLTTEEKARKTLSQGKKKNSVRLKRTSKYSIHLPKHPHITKQYKTTTVEIKTKCNRKSNTMGRKNST
jgi:hypothetical protein